MPCSKIRLASRTKGRAEVNIDGHYESKIYTSGSRISGEVVIYPSEDIQSPCVQVSLIGTAKTMMETVPAPRVTTCTFLAMDSPLTDQYDSFEAGCARAIPFDFIIPHEIPVTESTVNRPTGVMRSYQQKLPPSLGGGWEARDMSPLCCRIRYEIKAVVTKKTEDGKIIAEIAASRAITILPSHPEEPPSGLGEENVVYTLKKRKTHRGPLFKKLGYVTATLAEPEALRVDPRGGIVPYHEHNLYIDIGYELLKTKKLADTKPLEVNVVSGKIESQTWFSDTGMTKLPNMIPPRTAAIAYQPLCYTTSVPIDFEEVLQKPWMSEQKEEGHGSILRTSLKVSVASKANDVLMLPTFYSRIIARTYTVRLTINVGGVGGVNLNLSAPLQVVVQPSGVKLMSDCVLEEELPSFDSVAHARYEFV
ncbi:unnamed protein product [Clonostachys rosea f. rosea IK726]|uniref:Uncharacterized protein n=1 Tax=Clonostachys rosea f. rosea IK726 TaxID=1349383 RepID=A0ACA9TYJ6_BIOOC|nr:unnamed protein product [Clonostachys rosea f. rosea IK726]